jgi:hypothetical protein
MRKVLIVVITTLVLLSITSIAQADALSTQIRCDGCYSWDYAPGGYMFWVDIGEKITLTAFSVGGIGNKEYRWTAENGETVLGSSLELIFTESVKYTLVVTDDIGYITKTVEIVQSSSGSSCLPSFRSVAIQDEYRRSEYSAGDIFEVRARLKDTRDCPNYNFYWEADDENVAFTSPNSIKTDVIIGQGVRKGNMTITAVITNGEIKRKQSVIVKIVANTPPEIVSIRCDESLSYTRFNIYVDAISGKSGNENNDFVRCSIILKNETGRAIDSGFKTIKSGGFNFVFGLRPEGRGIYFVEVILKDSHDMISPIDSKMLKVEKGDTGKDIPVVFVSSDVIYCKVGEMCAINAGETKRRDPDISTFGYYMNGEQIVNPNGDYCSGPVCKFIPTYPGTNDVKITAKYFGNDNIGSKIITVIVSENKTSITLTPTPTQPTHTLQPTCCYPENQHYPFPKTPGMKIWTAIAAIIMVFVTRRKKI